MQQLRNGALRVFRSMPEPVKRQLVRRHTPNYTVGAVCVLVHEEEVLLLGQAHRPGWSLPGGLLGHGESAEDAVAREVAEEVGLLIDAGDPVKVAVHPDGQAVDVVYRVPLTERPEVRLASEAQRHAWRRPADLAPGEVDATTRDILWSLTGDHVPPRPGVLLPGEA